MSEIVQGTWGDFEFKMIEFEDIPRVQDHLKRCFYPDETMFSLAGYTDDLGDEVNQVVDCYIRQNDRLSFMAIHKESGKVAGVRITVKRDKNSTRPDDAPVTLDSHKNVLGFLKWFAGRHDVLEEFGVESYADLLMTSVDPEFRRRGLVSEMYSRSITLIKSRGFRLVESYFSSPYTRLAAIKNGFREIDRAYYAEALHEQGNKRFPTATDQFVACMIREL